MNIEKQVCTFEQAKELNELGVSQKLTLFYWYTGILSDNGKPEIHSYDWISTRMVTNAIVSAPTVAELGIMLGDGHPSWRFGHPDSGKKQFVATRLGPNDPNVAQKYKSLDLVPMNTYGVLDIYRATEAGARAELLLSFMKAKVEGFTADEVNERLQNA